MISKESISMITIETSRLLLRNYRVTDFEDIIKYFSDEEVSKFEDFYPTAYIEPVATVPEHRGKGIGQAVVYEAVNRAKERGAKRAIVLSDQDFYKRLGMIKSSEVGTWVRNSK